MDQVGSLAWCEAPKPDRSACNGLCHTVLRQQGVRRLAFVFWSGAGLAQTLLPALLRKASRVTGGTRAEHVYSLLLTRFFCVPTQPLAG